MSCWDELLNGACHVRVVINDFMAEACLVRVVIKGYLAQQVQDSSGEEDTDRADM